MINTVGGNQLATDEQSDDQPEQSDENSLQFTSMLNATNHKRDLIWRPLFRMFRRFLKKQALK